MFFKTSEEFELVDVNMEFSKLATHIVDAENQYILKVLGADQMAALQAAYTANSMDAAQTALLESVQAAIKQLALYIGLPKLNLRINDLGVKTTNSSDYDNASSGEMYFGRVQYLIDGYKALDTLFGFLELNISDYPLWEGSDAYLEYKQYFVNSATLFGKHVNAVKSRWLFSQLIAEMDTVETLRIKSVLGAAFFADLKSKFAAENLDNDETKLIFGDSAEGITGLVKPICLYTYAQSLIDPTIREILRISNAASADDLSNKGGGDYKSEYKELSEQKINEANALIAQVKDYLNATASGSVFPIYYASSLYKDPAATMTSTINDYGNGSSKASFAMI